MPRVSEEYLAARRQEILDAAVSLFSQRGFARTSMNDVVRASGTSMGAVYGACVHLAAETPRRSDRRRTRPSVRATSGAPSGIRSPERDVTAAAVVSRSDAGRAGDDEESWWCGVAPAGVPPRLGAAVVAGMNVEPLARRVVELIEGAPIGHLDCVPVLGMIALVLTGAGLVTLQNVALGGYERLPLLVAEPFPHVHASIAVVTATAGTDDALSRQLRRHTQHPSVDALVVAVPGSDTRHLPREIGGVSIRRARLRSPAAGTTS